MTIHDLKESLSLIGDYFKWKDQHCDNKDVFE